MPGTIAVGMCFNPSRPWKPDEGCAEMHWTPGMSRLSRRELPMNVPLVPMQATKCVIAPLVCSMISTAVPSKCAFQLAGLLYWSG